MIEPLIKALNLKAHVMFAEPDGQFPNHAPDPTEEENLSAIRDFKSKSRLFFGFCF